MINTKYDENHVNTVYRSMRIYLNVTGIAYKIHDRSYDQEQRKMVSFI